jgi:hypothetical protein
MAEVAVILLLWVGIWGGIGFAIGNTKGRGGEGFVLGIVLGFVGWIIEALMRPSAEFEAQRMSMIASTLRSQTEAPSSPVAGPTRICPWCAESIKAAASVCRFCGRGVEPIEPAAIAAPEEIEETPVEAVQDDYPKQYPVARRVLSQLPSPPTRPTAWLRELCKRMEAGAPPEAAAARIPLDWRDPAPPPKPPTVVRFGRPDDAGDFASVFEKYPGQYDVARAHLAGLVEAPQNPELWLRELCKRMEAGAPPEAAAARIPLDWSRTD